ncbi:MAG: ABC transporter permease [Pseudomonadota bacterium]
MMRSIYLVARRDYLGYVTAWGFWLGLLLTPFFLSLGIIGPALAASQTPERYYVVVDPDGALGPAMDEKTLDLKIDVIEAQIMALGALTGDGRKTAATFETAARESGDLAAALTAAGIDPETSNIEIPDDDFIRVEAPATTIDGLRPWLLGERLLDTPNGERPLFAALIKTDEGIEYWSENVTIGTVKNIAERAAISLARTAVFTAQEVPFSILDDVRAATPEILERKVREDAAQAAEVTAADIAPTVVSVAIAFTLWMLIFSVVNYLLMGTIEERSNKIFDTLLTSVKLPHLLAGKLLAVLAVSLTLMVFWAGGGIGAMTYAGSALPPDMSEMIAAVTAAVLKPGILIPALLSFLLGYLMYGAVFLAIGSLCDTVQEAQTLMSPMLVLLMVPLFMVFIAVSDPTSPVLAVMAWIPVFTPFLLILRAPLEPSLWEVLGQLSLMAVATAAILWAAARIYRAGAVHGAGVNDVLHWFKGFLPGMGKTKAG